MKGPVSFSYGSPLNLSEENGHPGVGSPGLPSGESLVVQTLNPRKRFLLSPQIAPHELNPSVALRSPPHHLEHSAFQDMDGCVLPARFKEIYKGFLAPLKSRNSNDFCEVYIKVIVIPHAQICHCQRSLSGVCDTFGMSSAWPCVFALWILTVRSGVCWAGIFIAIL